MRFCNVSLYFNLLFTQLTDGTTFPCNIKINLSNRQCSRFTLVPKREYGQRMTEHELFSNISFRINAKLTHNRTTLANYKHRYLAGLTFTSPSNWVGKADKHPVCGNIFLFCLWNRSYLLGLHPRKRFLCRVNRRSLWLQYVLDVNVFIYAVFVQTST